jgi:excisionase family DNA binding protein
MAARRPQPTAGRISAAGRREMSKSMLSVREAAVLTGRSERTIRRLIQQGKLSADRGDAGWRVRTDRLMQWLGEHRGTGVGADRLRQELDAVLSGASKRAASSEQPSRRAYSVADLKAFNRAQPVYRRLLALGEDSRPAAGVAAAASALSEGLECLSVGCHTWRRPEKIEQYVSAREHIARAAGRLLMGVADGDTRSTTCHEVAAVLEQDVLPAVNGLIRKLERKA